MDFTRVQGILKISVILTICAFTEQYSFVFHTTTPKPNFRTDCTENGLLLIKGDVISIAEVIKTVECWREANQINIFALSKVIFDDDIDKRDVLNVNIAIFAPTWEIIPPPISSSAMENQTQRRILLNADSEFNFYGVCIEKINGERLEFGVDGDKNRIKMIINNDPSMGEISLLKPTAIFISSFNEVPTLKAYRQYARANFEKTANHSNLWKFLVELKTQYTIADLNELLDDFLCLEDKYFELKKEIDVMPMYQSLRDQLEHPKQQLDGHTGLQNLLYAALISKILAIRNHTIITDILQMNGNHYLKTKISWESDVRRHESILNHHSKALEVNIECTNEFIATNTAFIDEVYNETVRNAKDAVDDAIIRHQMELPLKTIQLMLSTIAEDTNFLTQDKEQLFLSKFFEKFQHKLILFEGMLKDFVDISKQTGDILYISNYFSDAQWTVTDLLVEVNELLAQNDQNRTQNLLDVTFNAWPRLSNVIDDTNSNIEIQKNKIEEFNRMQGLMECSEYEKSIYKVILNLFKQTDTDEILPHLYELNGIFGKMQHHSLKYNSHIKRAIQDTNQAIKLTIDVFNNRQGMDDRQILLDILRSRSNEQNDSETQSKLDILNEIIKSNFILEYCLTSSLQILKMRVFPFDQDRFVSCDLPANTNVTWNSTNVKQILLKNIERFESGNDVRTNYRRKSLQDSITHANETQTLYEWKYKDFKHEIHRLLRGESLVLNADIANAKFKYAVKFNKVWLEFSFADEYEQRTFYGSAGKKWIYLQMMSNQYYQCENRYYYLAGINVGPLFSYEIDNRRCTMVYEEISKQDAYLSPYTIWKITIRDRNGIHLEKFMGKEMDLKLVGNIDYVSVPFNNDLPNMCLNEELNKYYLLDRIDDGLPTRYSRENDTWYSIS